MRDRNGVEFQDGDIVLDYMEHEDTFNTLAVVLETHPIIGVRVECYENGALRHLYQFPKYLEIIGSVR